MGRQCCAPAFPVAMKSEHLAEKAPIDLPAIAPVVAAGAPPLSQQEKQERQRMHVRRSYYKKRGYIRDLRDQVDALEKQYADALTHQPSPSSSSSSQKTPSDWDSDIARFLNSTTTTTTTAFAPPPTDAAAAVHVQSFMDLSTLRDTLRNENDELKKALRRYANFVRRVQQSLDDDAASNDTHTSGSSSAAASSTHHDVDALDFQPLTSQECGAITVHTFQEIKHFVQSQDGVSSSGVSLFGWQDKRRVVHEDESDVVEFCVQKAFPQTSSLQLSSATWAILSCPATFGALYSPSLSMDLRLLQRVDDDNVVFYRRIDRSTSGSGLKSITKSIFLLSRFRTELGYVILFRSCDSERQRRQRALLKQLRRSGSGSGEDEDEDEEDKEDKEEQEETDESWHDVFSWILFEEVQTEDQEASVKFSFGGRIDTTTAATPQFWMLEVLLLSLRWEASVVGPMFTLS